ncbi:MAG: UDP-N-acetylmuramoyl-tripeptide--D-alanyl-D-alanine ligase [Clostridia bacterium]|nr:UDP-N-acetylmuramoyl-tripeptide--D-alanyl-D-alanine ligase [Clostridia bacterium]
MAEFTIAELIKATGGTLCAPSLSLDTVITGATIDTRTLLPGELYVPIRGEVFDGHRFIPQAMEKGAALVLSEIETDAPHIRVKSCVKAYQDIAKLHRERFDIPIVCITGSVGKTTTKDMVKTVLEQHFATHATVGNLNNQTGVPTTVLRLGKQHEVSVMELGTNHFGEIDAIARVTQPTICLFTNIGEAHIEFFGSREGIFKGKTEMLQHARPGAKVIVNGDDDLLRTIPGAIRYGIGADNDVRAVDIVSDSLEHTTFTAKYFGHSLPVELFVAGDFMVQNALSAIAVGYLLGMTDEELQKGLAAFHPTAGRADIVHTDRFTLIDGTYNANPTSMESALRLLHEAKTRRVCIFADMLELGPDAPAYHERVGALAHALGIELFLCTGHLAQHAATYPNSYWFSNQAALQEALPSMLHDGDTILVKSSNGMHLKDTLRFIENM